MTSVFLRIFNMSIAAGWIVLAAVLFRCVFKKAPKRLRCLVWALVALRLVLPFTIESPIGLAPKVGEIPQEVISAAAEESLRNVVPDAKTPHLFSEAYQPAVVLDDTASVSASSAQAAAASYHLRTAEALAFIWLGGMCAMMMYFMVSFIMISLRTRVSLPLYDNVIVCDEAPTPFILGVFRPRIVLPSSITEQDAEFAVAHEKAHIKRGDHLIKPFAFALLSIYWFNPLMWLAYVLLCRDIELACDERVIKNGGAELKKNYTAALLNCSASNKLIAACPVAFGEVGVKERVKSVLAYKRATVSTIVAALLCCAAIAIFLLPTAASRVKADSVDGPAEFACLQDSSLLISKDAYRMVFGSTYEGPTGAKTSIVLYPRDFGFDITVKRSDGTVLTDTGKYEKLRGDELRLVSDSTGTVYEFAFRDGYLVYENKTLCGVFAERSTAKFGVKLLGGDTDDWTYRSENGNYYLLKKKEGILYAVGNPRQILETVVNEPYFKESPELTDALAKEFGLLRRYSGIGCKFKLGEDEVKLETSVNVYNKYMLQYTMSFGSSAEVGITFNPKQYANPYGQPTNRLTPGSLFAKGGKPYGY